MQKIKFLIPSLITIIILIILFKKFDFNQLFQILSLSNKVLLLTSSVVLIIILPSI